MIEKKTTLTSTGFQAGHRRRYDFGRKAARLTSAQIELGDSPPVPRARHGIQNSSGPARDKKVGLK